MKPVVPNKPPSRPRRRGVVVTHDGRDYPMFMDRNGWRLRCKKKKFAVDFRTGTANQIEAKRRALQFLEDRGAAIARERKGGGTLKRLATVYLDTPKATLERIAKGNVSRLKTVCRVVLDKELEAITCREVTPDFWQKYQRAMLAKAGHKFDLTTRHRENIPINAAVRCAKAMFIPAMLRAYKAEGLDVHEDAGQVVMLPEPLVEKAEVDQTDLLEAWPALQESDLRMWLVIGIARFAGLRMRQISAARLGWVEQKGNAVYLVMRDRPEERFWLKRRRDTYRPQVIDETLAEWLVAAAKEGPADKFIVPDPDSMPRDRWFEYIPQEWLRTHGLTADRHPLHRLRGLYADHVAQLTADAVATRLAMVKAAQDALGHTNPTTTEEHYLTPAKGPHLPASARRSGR